MDNIRFALMCVVAVLCFFIYQAWQTDYAPTQVAQSAQQQSAGSPSGGANGAITDQDADVPDLAQAPVGNSAQPGNNQPANQKSSDNTGIAPGTPVEQSHQVHVVTDKLDVIIDTRGGDLDQVALRGVPVSADKRHTDLRLINDSLPNFFIEQSGLVADGAKAPNHNSVFASQQDDYTLAKGQKTLQVPLTWTGADGRKVTKVYTFTRGSYAIGLDHRVDNAASTAWTLSQYVRFWRTPHVITGDVPFSKAFFGIGWYQAKDSSGYSYKTRGREDIDKDPLALTEKGGWIAMIQHYFIAAAIPPADSQARYFAKSQNVQGAVGGFASGFVGAKQTVAPGATADFKTTLFVGPKYQDALSAVAPGLGLTVDYGIFTILAKPIFWVLDHLHSVVGNWGLSIILLTFLIKALFYKLSEIQYRGMARMRKFQPRMAQLKEQYGEDKAELQKRMMDLYRKEGFNPLAGCWPMLVQMPVFISLYWVLRESVELRHAPFILWIQDLSAPDPYYILPVIFGATMFLQQRLNANVTMDPMQQRMMQIMPVGMAVFFAFFPAGLVLYWCTNNILSMAQQWWIYRKLDAEGLGRKASSS